MENNAELIAAAKVNKRWLTDGEKKSLKGNGLTPKQMNRILVKELRHRYNHAELIKVKGKWHFEVSGKKKKDATSHSKARQPEVSLKGQHGALPNQTQLDLIVMIQSSLGELKSNNGLSLTGVLNKGGLSTDVEQYFNECYRSQFKWTGLTGYLANNRLVEVELEEEFAIEETAEMKAMYDMCSMDDEFDFNLDEMVAQSDEIDKLDRYFRAASVAARRDAYYTLQKSKGAVKRSLSRLEKMKALTITDAYCALLQKGDGDEKVIEAIPVNKEQFEKYDKVRKELMESHGLNQFVINTHPYKKEVREFKKDLITKVQEEIMPNAIFLYPTLNAEPKSENMRIKYWMKKYCELYKKEMPVNIEDKTTGEILEELLEQYHSIRLDSAKSPLEKLLFNANVSMDDMIKTIEEDAMSHEEAAQEVEGKLTKEVEVFEEFYKERRVWDLENNMVPKDELTVNVCVELRDETRKMFEGVDFYSSSLEGLCQQM